MMCPIDERPELTGDPTFAGIDPKQANAHTEQNAPTKLQRVRLLPLPWEGMQEWQPRIFELRQFFSAHLVC